MTLNRKRWLGFILIMFLGTAAGLVYGWVLHPARVNNTTLDSLRSDYKADYVLMVAETYQSSADLDQAKQDLDAIQPGEPYQAVQQALVTAQSLGYPISDLQVIALLESALKSSAIGQAATP